MIMFFYVIVLITTSLSSTFQDDLPKFSDSCDLLADEIAVADSLSETIHPPPVLGTWVSQRCEVHQGPKFLLRKAEFLSNQTFRVTEFHYGDEACSAPMYSVVASGEAPPEASWVLRRLAITAYSSEVAEELYSRINSSCPGYLRRRWRPYRENVLLSTTPEWPSFTDNLSPPPPPDEQPPLSQTRKRTSMGVSILDRHPLSLVSTQCMTLLQAELPQMDAVMVQRRPSDPLYHRPRLEMFLGSSPSQTPLLRSSQAEGCEMCAAVARGWERAPPQLLSQPRLPPLLSGEWISGRCERRPSGVLHLTRRFLIQDRHWMAEYRFFSDSLCSRPTLKTLVSGFFIPLSAPSRMPGSVDFDFHVERATLTLLDEGFTDTLHRDWKCSLERNWQVGQPVELINWRDVRQGRRCKALSDFIVPPVHRQIARVEISSRGTALLLLGQPDLIPSIPLWGPLRRPTAYQPPLIQCAGELPPLTHFLTSQSSYPSHGTSVQPVSRMLHILWILYVLVLILR